MAINIPIAMFGWIPFVLLLFGAMPPKRALVFVYMLGWLVLPNVTYNLPGLPDYSKTSATSYAVLIATAIYDGRRLLRFRPRWFDLPVLVYTVSPFVSSILNDLGWYDGLSNVMGQFLFYGTPYLMGRIYFDTAEDLKALAVGIFVGGLCYVPPCLVEIRLSPQVKYWVYGIQGFEFMRYGGYRPMVLLATGLELGMWMTAACLAGYALWAARERTQVWGVAIGTLLGVLLVTTVLCKSTGTLLLLAIGVATLWAAARLRTAVPLLVLIFLPPTYALVRTTGWWDGRGAVDLTASLINAERADSIEYRLNTEDGLIGKALQRPFFGWGGYNRERLYDENGRCLSITDGHWIMDLGVRGLVGLVAWNLMMLLPAVRMLRRCPPRAWLDPGVAPVAALALVALLYAFDCLSNNMYNPIYLVISGGVSSVAATVGASRRRPELDDEAVTADGLAAEARSHARDAERFEAAAQPDQAVEAHRRALGAWEALVERDPADPAARRALARAYEAFARTPALADRPEAAGPLRASALEWWDSLLADAPDDPDARSRCGVARGDLAWLLLSRPDAAEAAIARAVALAEAAVDLAPDQDACRNTLATAYYRLGDWRATIDVVDRAGREGHGHPGYDPLLLAMAYQRLGDRARARRWLDRGDAWWRAHGRDLADLGRLRREADALINAPADPAARAALPAPELIRPPTAG